MNDLATKIQQVINSLPKLILIGSYENSGILLGIYQTLAEARDEANAMKMPEAPEKGVGDNAES